MWPLHLAVTPPAGRVWPLKHMLRVCFLCLQAPEVFIGNYGTEADMWAAGMMMYQLIADRFPWCASSAICGSKGKSRFAGALLMHL